MQTNNVNFTGMLYGKMGSHLTKGILCCVNGDAKFVRTVNKIAKTNPKALKISTDNFTTTKLIIESDETPTLSLFERLFYKVNKTQSKAIKMKQAGKIQGFIYKINEIEYSRLKKDYMFITKKTLREFEENLRKLTPQENKNDLRSFF